MAPPSGLNSMYARVEPMSNIVSTARAAFESWLEPKIADTEAKALELFGAGEDKAAIDALTRLAIDATAEATARWTALWQTIMVTNLDGGVASVDENDLLCGCAKKGIPSTVRSELAP